MDGHAKAPSGNSSPGREKGSPDSHRAILKVKAALATFGIILVSQCCGGGSSGYTACPPGKAAWLSWFQEGW